MVLLHRYAAILILSIASLLGAAPEAQAEQCVFNRGGYVMHVHWYRIGSLAVSIHDPNMDRLVALTDPVSSNILTLGTGACNKSAETLIAAVHVVGCVSHMLSRSCNTFWVDAVPFGLISRDTKGVVTWYNPNTYYPNNAGSQGNQPVPAPIMRVYPGGPSTYTLHSGFPPTAPFWMGVPSTARYLDFWGTIFDIQWGPGGPI